MKVKNLVIGLRVQVKREHTGFFSWNAGAFGTIVDIDDGDSHDVKIQYEDGRTEWGNHKGIKRASVEPTEPEVQEPSTPATVEVGSRVRLKHDKVLGFLKGDVGTVKAFDSFGDAVVCFDEERNGWESHKYGIPDLRGLYVIPSSLEVITD